MLIRTRQVLVALIVGGVTLALSAPWSAAFASDQPIAPASSTVRPQVSSQYAEAAFDAWITADRASLVDLAAPEVAQLLAARSADEELWPAVPGVCDGAAGSVYCTWNSSNVQLTLRVANQAATAGAAHAVTEASITPTPGAVAIWPLTTTDEAWRTQAQVDAGHSPWMLDPEAVVSNYAARELGFTQPVVELVAPTFFSYRVVDAATGVAVDIAVNQPARAEPGGIWAIARVASLPADAPGIPL
jgi:hypothetical protein